jgi:hypothetical protein
MGDATLRRYCPAILIGLAILWVLVLLSARETAVTLFGF